MKAYYEKTAVIKSWGPSGEKAVKIESEEGGHRGENRFEDAAGSNGEKAAKVKSEVGGIGKNWA